jgi:hypothetical protein
MSAVKVAAGEGRMSEIPQEALAIAKTSGVSEAAMWKHDSISRDAAEAIAYAAVRDYAAYISARETASDDARAAEVLHAEHHPGTFVPSLDSCPVHERADYEERVRQLRGAPS